VLFLGPDPEIMENHDISPRTERENAAMKNEGDPPSWRWFGIGCRPAAMRRSKCSNRWARPRREVGDIITGVFTPSGDLAVGSTGACCCSRAWFTTPSSSSESIGKANRRRIREGDGFIHNDARYGISTIPTRA